MDRNTRLALIEKLAADKARDAEDLAERRYQREMRGEYFDDPPPQRFVRKTFETPTPQAADDYESAMIDGAVAFVNERLDEEITPLREQLAAVVADMTIMQAALRERDANWIQKLIAAHWSNRR